MPSKSFEIFLIFYLLATSSDDFYFLFLSVRHKSVVDLKNRYIPIQQTVYRSTFQSYKTEQQQSLSFYEAYLQYFKRGKFRIYVVVEEEAVFESFFTRAAASCSFCESKENGGHFVTTIQKDSSTHNRQGTPKTCTLGPLRF